MFPCSVTTNGANFPIPLSIMSPPQALRVGDTCTTSLRLRAGRFAAVEAATRVAGSALTWQQPPARVWPQKAPPLRRLGDVWSDANITSGFSE